MRDFGLLRGARKKVLCRPLLQLPTVEHLLLTAAGAKSRQVPEDPAWRLFLRTPAEVAHLFSQLAVEWAAIQGILSCYVKHLSAAACEVAPATICRLFRQIMSVFRTFLNAGSALH